MGNNTGDDFFEKRRVVLERIGLSIYGIIIVVQIAMFFIMQSTGLIEHSIREFVLVYMVRPLGIDTIIVIISLFIIRKSKTIQVKNMWEILMITLMVACTAYVHHVFSVLLITFCVPIFLTVFLQDRLILIITTITCEIISAAISMECFLTKSGAYHDTYFIPTVILIMIVHAVCGGIAARCIDILNEQSMELLGARNEALEAKQVADVSNQSKSLFLSNMSHEIRTPLNTVLSLDTMILRESKEKQIQEYAIDIRNAGQTVLSIINDVLDFSKIESGKMELVEVSYDFASVIHDVMNMITSRADNKGLNLRLKLDETLPAGLIGDDARLRQILLNLLSNAVKYTEKGNVVLEVTGERKDENIVLQFHVKDTGIGIKEEDMERLFTKFERVDEKRNRNIEGTGLGISITSAFLSMMGSELKVDSVYGKGSDFHFELVQRIELDEPIGKLEERIHNSRTNGKYSAAFTAPEARVLVVDDNEMNRNVFAALLKKTKIVIDEAEDGFTCLNMVQKQAYDLIFLDHMMPEMDGIETLHKMQELGDYINKDTPIIALTANAIVGAKEEYLAEGFKDYFSKPLDPVKLETLIVSYLPEEKVVLEEKEDESESETAAPAETEDGLPVVEGIRWDVALRGFGDKRLLITAVKDFITFGKKNRDTLQLYYDKLLRVEPGTEESKKVLSDYRILIHAMKTNVGMIGALSVSGIAGWLEHAAVDERIVPIINITPDFLQEWNRLLAILKEHPAFSEDVMMPGFKGFGNAQQSEEEPVTEPPRKMRTDKCILVVDDSPQLLRAVKRALDDEYQIVLASTGAKAVEMMDKKHFDLVLLDYEMPGMNGAEVYAHIMLAGKEPLPKVVFLYRLDDPMRIETEVSPYGTPAGYLQKPIDMVSLDGIVKETLAALEKECSLLKGGSSID